MKTKTKQVGAFEYEKIKLWVVSGHGIKRQYILTRESNDVNRTVSVAARFGYRQGRSTVHFLTVPSSFVVLWRIIVWGSHFVTTYEFSQPFWSAKMFQFFLGRFCETVSKAPLSWRVNGIGGQTNTLSNPLLHLDHNDAVY